MRLVPFLLVALAWALPPCSDAATDRSGFAVQVFAGTAFSAPTTLEIHQPGSPPLKVRATWETRPLDQPFYWAVRLRYQRTDDGFELQLLHHKLYLGNPTAEIEHFEVTHGFNVVTAHYVKSFGWVDARLGAGVVIPHAESVVRGTHHEASDYVLGGPALLAGFGSEHVIAERFLVAAEIQAVAGWATVTVDNGRADVAAFGVHALLGAGFVF